MKKFPIAILPWPHPTFSIKTNTAPSNSRGRDQTAAGSTANLSIFDSYMISPHYFLSSVNQILYYLKATCDNKIYGANHQATHLPLPAGARWLTRLTQSSHRQRKPVRVGDQNKNITSTRIRKRSRTAPRVSGLNQ